MPAIDAICLMGPTAAGKTGFALRLAAVLPVDVVSVDSAMVYRGMNIGTAKPDAETLAEVPHRLIDIRDPEETYSAGDFVRDARAEMRTIAGTGRVPLLVGGTMLYFRALTEGIAELPPADSGVRAAIDAEALIAGWQQMHAMLATVDPAAAERINPNDSQRIQRALEVYRSTGRTLSDFQAESQPADSSYRFLKIALRTASRQDLHERIAARLDAMFAAGFVDEVRRLNERPGLDASSPSMRAVGYRQVLAHVQGQDSFENAADKALFATRQLAKRQMTWLRGEPKILSTDPLEDDSFDTILAMLQRELSL